MAFSGSWCQSRSEGSVCSIAKGGIMGKNYETSTLLGKIAPRSCFRSGNWLYCFSSVGVRMRRMRYNIAVVAHGSSGLGPSSDIAGTPGRGSADTVTLCLTPGGVPNAKLSKDVPLKIRMQPHNFFESCWTKRPWVRGTRQKI